MSDKSAENLRRIRAWDAEWDESKHSRADNGQFTSGGGGGGAKKAPEYGGYTPPKFHGTKEQIFKQATAQGKKNAARAAVLANATPVKAKFSKKEQDVLKGTDASEKDIQKLIGQIPHMSDPEAWSRVHDFCFSDEQADQVFKILKSKAAKAAKPAAPPKASSKAGTPGIAVDVSKFKFKNYRNPDGQHRPGYETYRSAMESAAREIEKQAERVLTSYGGSMPPAEQYDTARDHIFGHASFRDIVSPSSDPGLKECENALHKRAQVLYEHLKQFNKWDKSQRRWVKG